MALRPQLRATWAVGVMDSGLDASHRPGMTAVESGPGACARNDGGGGCRLASPRNDGGGSLAPRNLRRHPVARVLPLSFRGAPLGASPESITTVVCGEWRCGPSFAPHGQWGLWIPGSMLRIAPE